MQHWYTTGAPVSPWLLLSHTLSPMRFSSEGKFPQWLPESDRSSGKPQCCSRPPLTHTISLCVTDAYPVDTSPPKTGPVWVTRSMYIEAQYLAPNSSSTNIWWNMQSLFINIRSGCPQGIHLWERLPNSSMNYPDIVITKEGGQASQLLFLQIYQGEEKEVWELEGPLNWSHRNYLIPILAFRNHPGNEQTALLDWSPALLIHTCDCPSTCNIHRPTYCIEFSVVMSQETCDGPQEFHLFS